MELGRRYGELIAPSLREEPLRLSPRPLPEVELQAHWFAGDFGRDFHTTCGRPVRIVQFGIWNREAGPDFAETVVQIGDDEPQSGCIELDPDARDWERHGHATNPAYEGVILHVFMQRGDRDLFTRTLRHRQVPQVLLDPATIANALPNPQPAAREGRCAGPLRELPDEKVREILHGAAQHRLRRKAAALQRLIELHGYDEALYQALAATLGYKSNKLPFTLLAQRLPLRVLRKRHATAMLFGASGFLPATELSGYDLPTRSYLRELWDEWWPRRQEFERFSLSSEQWKLGGVRPTNHPQRRLGALGRLISHWPKMRALARRGEVAPIRDFFRALSDPYWDYHYTVRSRPAARPMALVGDSRVTEMLANVFCPLAIAASEKRWSEYAAIPADLSNRRVEIATLRLFGPGPRGQAMVRTAAQQQGLLQVYEDFCQRDASDCARCLFPVQVTRW